MNDPREKRTMEHVLFVCDHNVAQAFFERLAPEDVRAESAGTEPAAQVWPEVIDAMAEVGIDIAARKPRMLTRAMQLRADLAVTMGCGDSYPSIPTRTDEWDIPDPAERPSEEVREIRDTVERHVRALIDDRLAETCGAA